MGRLYIHKKGRLVGIIDDDLNLEWLDENVFGEQSRPSRSRDENDDCGSDGDSEPDDGSNVDEDAK